MTSTETLLRPFSLKTLTLKNRIVMSPMTRGFAENGIPAEVNAAYYRRRAEAEVGLILSEGTVIDRPAARNMPGIPFFHGEAALAGWTDVLDGVHAAGGRMGPQIWHVGSVRALPDWEADAERIDTPSGIEAPGKPRGRVMTEEDIADTIAAFARAAADAKRLGFDALEIHGAHGYLIDQFFWSGTNLRSDRYGGATLAERSRFGVEVVKAIRQAVGPDFPFILRVSQWKLQDYSARLAETPDEMQDWLLPLVEAGADILHCSQRRFWEPEFPEIDGAHGLNFAGWAKKLTGAPTISVGSVGLSSDFLGAFAGEGSKAQGIDALVQRMERGEFDLVAVGRALLNDPQWARKILYADDAPLKDFSAAAMMELI